MTCSLLYEDQTLFTEYAADPLFSDLHLDEIIAAATGDLTGYDLASIYRQKPVRTQDILFRQAIVRDLQRKELTGPFETFMQGLNLAKRYLFYSEQAIGHPQAAKWHLDSARIYCGAVDQLAKKLALIDERSCSPGISRFAAWLCDYAGSLDFIHLRQQVAVLAEAIDDCRFTLRLDIAGQTIIIEQDTGGNNYLDDLLCDFTRFDLGHLRRDTVAFADIQMNALENQTFSLPCLQEEPAISIEGGFDMALALKGKASSVVLNDLAIHPEEKTILLTGPNQGGKSTFARMLGQTAWLASLGLPVPCRNASLYITQGIQTHFGRQENAGSRSGRLQEELLRLQRIMQAMPEGCLVILNELFSSATTDDACEMAVQVMKKLRSMNCLCLYVSHLHELAEYDLETVTLVAEVSDGDPPVCTFRVLRRPIANNSGAWRLLLQYHLTRAEIEARKNDPFITVHE